MISTRSPPPGVSVSLDGLKLMFGTPLLDAFQLRLWLLELLLIDAVQAQPPGFGLKVQSLLALKLPEPGTFRMIFGAGCTVSVT